MDAPGELSLTQERDRVFEKVQGRDLQEYDYPVPAGMMLVPETPPKKPRGKGKLFSSSYQPRWGKK
jgi:hypothetical protein